MFQKLFVFFHSPYFPVETKVLTRTIPTGEKKNLAVISSCSSCVITFICTNFQRNLTKITKVLRKGKQGVRTKNMLFIVGTSSADPPHVSRFLFGSRSSNHSNRQCRRGITKQVETHIFTFLLFLGDSQ